MAEMACVSTRVSFSLTRKVRKVRESFLPLLRQEFGRRHLDPQQLAAGMRHCAWTDSALQTHRMILGTFAVLQLVHMTFVILSLIRMTFEKVAILQLVRMNSHDR